MKGRVLGLGLVLAVCGAVFAGIVMFGGPQQARLDQQDEETYYLLRRLSNYITCRGEATELPETLRKADLATHCNASDAIEIQAQLSSATQEVTYERVSKNRFKLCGAFHDAERVSLDGHNRGIDSETGCLEGSIRDRD